MKITDPADGMPANDSLVEVVCPCGGQVKLWYNGGELDQRDCRCGRVYSLESVGTILRVEVPEEAQ